MSTLQEIEVEALKEQLSEMASNMEAVMAENEQLTKLVTADAALAGAVAEIKSLNKQLDALRERNAGLMEEKNAAIRTAKLASRKAKA